MLPLSLMIAIYLADVNADGIVGWDDARSVIAHMGQHGRGDLTQDGVIDALDFLAIIRVFASGWGVHDTGDGRVWYVRPGDAISVGASPFPGRRRLTFFDEHGSVMAIDMRDSQPLTAPPTTGDAP